MTDLNWEGLTDEKPPVELQGSVAHPGRFLPKDNATFGEYLQLAGGLTLDPKKTRVTISRARDGGGTETVSYRFEPMEQLPTPQAGDIVRLEEEASSYPAPKRLRNNNPTAANVAPTTNVIIKPSRVGTAEEELELSASLEKYTREPKVKRLFNQVASYITATNSKVVGIISPTPSEQKQLVTAALAKGFSEFLDTRVLVIGLDRKSKVLSCVQSSREHSQSTAANGGSKFITFSNACVDVTFADHLQETCHAKLDFYIQAIIQQVRNEYDLILLDLPWYLNSEAPVDAIVAGSQTDSCLIVLDSHAQDIKDISKFKREMERHRISCLGTVEI